MKGLVGRGAELASLGALQERAERGEGAAVVVRGEAGIGKTTLLDAVAARARGFRVLRTRGHESELELPFAGLAVLLAPLLDNLEDVPPPQALAVRGALALQDVPVVDPFAVAAGTFALIALAAATAPLLLLVDDLQWLDTATAGVVLFVARRIADVRALVLLAARDGEPTPPGVHELDSLDVGGLELAAATELLAQDPTRAVAPHVAPGLVERTGGNPLALLEVQALLDPDVREGRKALDDPLPVGVEVERLFLGRAEALPPDTRYALVRAAADPDVPLTDPHALEPAEASGLVSLRGGSLEFRHPLVRSAVYYGATPADRRRAHADLAAALDGSDHARHALHLALSSVGPNEEVAAALEREAQATMARAGVAEAARLLELSAQLSLDSANSARRYAQAASTLVFAGQLDRASLLAEEARVRAPDSRTAAVALQAVAVAQLWRGETMGAHQTFLEAAQRVVETDKPLAASFYADAVHPAFTASRVREALGAARRAHELAAGTGGAVEPRANVLFTTALVLAGEAGTRPEAVERLDRLVPPNNVLDLVAAAGYALTLIWLEEFERAREVLSDVRARAQAAGAVSALPLLLATHAETELWLGNGRAALAAGVEGEALCEQIGGHVAAPYLFAVLARVEATMGLGDRARQHAEQALAFARPRGIDSIEFYAGAAAALADLTEGRHDAVVARLDPLRTLAHERGVAELCTVPWHGDLAEAAIAGGRGDIAESTLEELETFAERMQSRWAAGVAARLRAPDESDPEAEFERASELLRHTPLEWARTRLAFGTWLRRARRRTDARTPLREALNEFERAGAVPWATQARDELAAAGERVSATVTLPAEQVLSPQELRIALLVAEGATNREAAARLVVSPKTIEYHLANAYRKLGVRSRLELAKRVLS